VQLHPPVLGQPGMHVRVLVGGVVVADVVQLPTRVGAGEWKHRYRGEGLGGLEDRPKPGRPPVIDEAEMVVATLEAPPERLGVTHWSSRLLGAELGLSHVTIVKVWRSGTCSPD
jgi:hypothetical protein